MLRHAARAVPWSLVAAACAVVPVLLAMAAAWPDDVWPLQGIAVGLTAGVGAWCMDERAAAVVDTLPRPLWWRTVARSAALVPLAAVWTASVVAAGDRLPDHQRLFVLQGIAALVAGVAVATARRARGVAMPGLAVAPALVAAVGVVALVRPAADHVPLFPIWPWEAWGRSAVIWWAVLVAAAAALAVALAGRPVLRRAEVADA
jgi:hypothetical protein